VHIHPHKFFTRVTSSKWRRLDPRLLLARAGLLSIQLTMVTGSRGSWLNLRDTEKTYTVDLM